MTEVDSEYFINLVQARPVFWDKLQETPISITLSLHKLEITKENYIMHQDFFISLSHSKRRPTTA